jgi:hypothetical protein
MPLIRASIRLSDPRSGHACLQILHGRLATPPPMPTAAAPRLHLSLAILRRHLVMPHLAILRRRRAMPCRPELRLETQWPTARSATGHITRKAEPISETTANIITARDGPYAGETLFLFARHYVSWIFADEQMKEPLRPAASKRRLNYGVIRHSLGNGSWTICVARAWRLSGRLVSSQSAPGDTLSHEC